MSLRRGPVMSEIVPGAAMLSIGEAPGGTEVQEGHPFVGQSGQEYEIGLRMGGLYRTQVSTANVICCQPPKNELDELLKRIRRKNRKAAAQAVAKGLMPPKPQPDPIECCFPRLQRDIEEAQAQVILAIGGTALKNIVRHIGAGNLSGPVGTISEQHGFFVKTNAGQILGATLHPAFAMRDAKHFKHVIREDIAKSAGLAARMVAGEDVDIQLPPSPAEILHPTSQQVIDTCDLFVRRGTYVAVDIETDSIDTDTTTIRCVQMTQSKSTLCNAQGVPVDEVTLVVPFRWMNGSSYWDSRLLDSVADAVQRVLDRCPLIFHNGSFDTRVLLRVGLMGDWNKTWTDTLQLHRCSTACDQPHSLGYCSARQFCISNWKKSVDHKCVDHVTDDILHKYGMMDAQATRRIEPALSEEVRRIGALPQFERATKLLPIARNMGYMGPRIDEVKRGELVHKFNELTERFRKKVQDIVGFDINPGSPDQVGTWLYDTKGYAPPADTRDGDQQTDGEEADWATGQEALIELQANGVDAVTNKFIDGLLEYRSVMKVRGYLNKLPTVADPDLDVEWLPPVVVQQRVEKKRKSGNVITYEDVEILPRRPAITRLPVNWKITPVTDRWASEPNCLDDQTEYLTDEGWLPVAKATEATRVAQYWSNTGLVDFVNPTSVIRKWYCGQMVVFSGEQTDLLVTPEHRMLYIGPYGLREKQAQELIPEGCWLLHSVAGIYSDNAVPESVCSEVVRPAYTPLSSEVVSQTFQDHTGYVYCVSVPSTFIVVRRNGKVTVVGNCQNVSSRLWDKTNLRELFIAVPGHILCAADMDQVELRLFTEATDDEMLRAEIAKGADSDPHSLNAAFLNANDPMDQEEILALYHRYLKMKKGSDEEKGKVKYIRVVAKQVQFGCQYGGTGPTLYGIMVRARDKATNKRMFPDITLAKAKRYYDIWSKAHPGAKPWQDRAGAFVARHGYIGSMYGDHRRFFPGGLSKPDAAPNALIQSSVGVRMGEAILEINDVLPVMGDTPWSGLILHEHDQLVLSCKTKRAAEMKALLRHTMEITVGRMPLTCSPKSGPSWATLD